MSHYLNDEVIMPILYNNSIGISSCDEKIIYSLYAYEWASLVKKETEVNKER